MAVWLCVFAIANLLQGTTASKGERLETILIDKLWPFHNEVTVREPIVEEGDKIEIGDEPMKETFIVEKVIGSKIYFMSPSTELHNIGSRLVRKPLATVTAESIQSGDVTATLYDPIFEKGDVLDIGHGEQRETMKVQTAIGKNITFTSPSKFVHKALSRISKSSTETSLAKSSDNSMGGQTVCYLREAIFEPGMLVEIGGQSVAKFAQEKQAAQFRKAAGAAGSVMLQAQANASFANLVNETLSPAEQENLKNATGMQSLPVAVVRLEMANGRQIGFSGLPEGMSLPEGTTIRKREYTYFLNSISAYWAEFRVADPLLKAGDVVQIGNSFPKVQAIVTATREDDVSTIISFDTQPLPYAFLAGTKIELYKFAESTTLASMKSGHKGCVVKNNDFEAGDIIRIADQAGYEDFEVSKVDGTKVNFKDAATKNVTDKGAKVYKITTSLVFKVQEEWRDIYVSSKIFKLGDIVFIGPPDAGEMAKIWHIYTDQYGTILTLDHGVTRTYDVGVQVTLVDPSVMVADYHAAAGKTAAQALIVEKLHSNVK
jgi:hypothetical protein